MTLHKIISSGRSGVGHAALAAATELGLLYGGWRGRGFLQAPIDGPDPADSLRIASGGEKAAALQNLLDGDALLLLSRGPLDELCKFLRQLAGDQNRRWRHIDLAQGTLEGAGRALAGWIHDRNIQRLTVYGSTRTADPVIADLTRNLLTRAYFLSFRDLTLPGTSLIHSHPPLPDAPPQTVAAALELLADLLPLKDKVALARMSPNERVRLNSTLGRFILSRFRLWMGNPELLSDCRRVASQSRLEPHQAPQVIISRLCDALQQTHGITRVK